MRELHILAGLVALVAGALALLAGKGSRLHRRSGQLFAVAMLGMCGSAAILAGFISPNRVNVSAALLTAYLVISGWLTVARPFPQVRRLTAGLALLAVAVACYSFHLAGLAVADPRGLVDKVPAPPLIMFGVVGLLAAALDLRLLRAGQIAGKHRLARHLWRMGYALWIATMSFFLGQAKLFPAAIRESGLLAAPVLLLAGLLGYWLWRTLRGRRRSPTEASERGLESA